MSDASSLLRRYGGAVRTRELLAEGWTERRIRSASDSGLLLRARQGWYVSPDLAGPARTAVAGGGVLTCAHALQAHGVWAVLGDRVHLRRTRHAKAPRRRPVGDLTSVHWRAGRSGNRLVSAPLDALLDYRGCAEPLIALAAVDSALRLFPHLRPALQAHGLLTTSTDGVCESGIEFILWHRLLRNLGGRRQVMVPGVGRVDFLVGSRLVIEVDGRRFHDSESSFEADRRRDASLSMRGYRVLRFSYAQVVGSFTDVEASIRAAIARHDHH